MDNNRYNNALVIIKEAKVLKGWFPAFQKKIETHVIWKT